MSHWPCCICADEDDLTMWQNPWGDVHVVCVTCLPTLKEKFQ